MGSLVGDASPWFVNVFGEEALLYGEFREIGASSGVGVRNIQFLACTRLGSLTLAAVEHGFLEITIQNDFVLLNFGR